MSKVKPPTYSEIIEQLLTDLDGPIDVNELIDRFLEIRIPKTKNPRSSVRSKLPEEKGRLLVYGLNNLIYPLWMAHQGIRFRVRLTKKILYKGLLPLDDFIPFLPVHTKLDEIEFLEQDGTTLDVRITTITKKVKSLLGEYDQDSYYVSLKNWFNQKKARGNDYILVTVYNYDKKVFCLEHESSNHLDQELLAFRNQQLADIFFDLLEQSRYERLYLFESVPTAYVRLPEKSGYPPDTVSKIIADDPRMHMSGGDIRYSDAAPNMFESMIADVHGVSTTLHPQKFTLTQGKQIYRFKVALTYRKGLWRKIEIQGKQTLADFNRILMSAFDHDWDHMGGFWKLVPRGRSGKRYREVDVGSVNPFGEGDGADTPIAGLGLAVGNRLKYVYDFGDWIEHEITLEDIISPDNDVDYPQIAAQNKPRYKYCQICKENAEKAIATWICIECSNREQQDVLVCEDCLDEYHPEHYADEMVY